MQDRHFTRTQLGELLVDGLARASKAHSAGEIQRTLNHLGVSFSRTEVQELLNELVDAGRLAFTMTTFIREGSPHPGRAYHSLKVLDELRARGPKDPFEGLVGENQPAESAKTPHPEPRKSLLELAEDLARKRL